MPPVKKSLLFTPVKNIIWEELFLKIFQTSLKQVLERNKSEKSPCLTRAGGLKQEGLVL